MKDITQAKSNVFNIYDSAGKRLMLISSGLDVLTVMQIATESKDSAVGLPVLSDALWFVEAVLEEQVKGLENDVDELMKATKEKA